MADKRKVVIDCDTGVDDAMALLLCLKRLDVLGITTVGGNVGLQNTQRNTRYVTEIAGRTDVPVLPGTQSPCWSPFRTPPMSTVREGWATSRSPNPKSPWKSNML